MKNNNSKSNYITIFSTIFLSLLILLSVFVITNKADAQGNNKRIKLVKTIEIQEGDTLWNIASQYKSDEYSDIRVYINEIKKSNNIYSDEIYSGNYIIVPYYCDAAN
ncbi:MAG TPA: LysM peptidoglycan-binding domain-containing protein [Clostridiales bacterium]|nr:LysM peptidoglycan-binding domain-containing protein [Clostridiales bacterium]